MTEADRELVLLFRPTGLLEMELVRASGWRKWPPRLPEQPTFYPVLNEDYAAQIARDWNATSKDSRFVGYVMRFCVRESFLRQYEVQRVGGDQHLEYWIPADDLDEFNTNIEGAISIVREFHCREDGIHDEYEDGLDRIARAVVLRDTDPNYTEHYVAVTKTALRHAVSVAQIDEPMGKKKVEWFDGKASLMKWPWPREGNVDPVSEWRRLQTVNK